MSTESLYGVKKPKADASRKDVNSSSTLAFSTQLSSLISKGNSSSPSEPVQARPRPSKRKPDIFSVHNRGAKKRAAADISDDVSGATQQVHKRGADIGAVDDAVLHRSKRKMAEKVELYDELKRGDYLVDSSDEEEEEGARNGPFSAVRRAEGNSLVDFDRKWAETEASTEQHGDDDALEANDDDEGPLVEYEDEFGRTRQGTRAEASEASRSRKVAESNDGGAVQDTARPARPTNIIYGSAVQSEAFNPDANITAKMSHLAQRRDRSPTPPEERHYDAESEVRTRGTGFYAFSKDESQRKQEMENLTHARNETLNERDQAASKKSAREKAKEERKKKIEELRGKRRAEQFLSGLEGIGIVPSAEPEAGSKTPQS